MILLLILNIIYFLLTVLYIYNNQQKNDFMSLYLSAKAMLAGEIPYQQFFIIINQHTIQLPYNLNPPIVFLLFSPLITLSYLRSAIVWLFVSMGMGLFSFYLSLSILFSREQLGRYWMSFGVFYLMFGASLLNESFLQLGTLLALLILGGYYLLEKQWNIAAGASWGVAAAIKFFPALLFFYLISQKKWRAAAVFLCTVLSLFVIPLFYSKPNIYNNYFHVLQYSRWYGDSLNASLYGYLFRIFSVFNISNFNQKILQVGCGVSFIVFFLWYIKQLVNQSQFEYRHSMFSLTLVVMLLLSPFGWHYYCTILIFPILMLLKNWLYPRVNYQLSSICLLLSFFVLNLPMPYLHVKDMHNMLDKVVFYSLYFYSLLVLMGLSIQKQNTMIARSMPFTNHQFIPVIVILIACFLIRLIYLLLLVFRMTCWGDPALICRTPC
jgi:hypothetical protein